MSKYPRRGLFISGTNTDVGKTYVGCLIAAKLRANGYSVGVYKPAASGCELHNGVLVSEDATLLWEAAGKPSDLKTVCPQQFEAPIAPHLSAQAEGKKLDEDLLLTGLESWRGQCDIVLVEGAGGLMSPLGDNLYNADLACEFNYPLVVVAANWLGVINDTLQTLNTAATFRDGLQVAGTILNNVQPSNSDASRLSNAQEIAKRSAPPLLAEISWQQQVLNDQVDWMELAKQ